MSLHGRERLDVIGNAHADKEAKASAALHGLHAWLNRVCFQLSNGSVNMCDCTSNLTTHADTFPDTTCRKIKGG